VPQSGRRWQLGVVESRAPGRLRRSHGAPQNRPRHASRRTRYRKSDLRIGACPNEARLDRALFDNGAEDLTHASAKLGGRSSRDSNSLSPSSRSHGTKVARVISRGRRAERKSATSEGVDSYTRMREARALDRYGANNRHGRSLRATASPVEYNWVQPPAGTAVFMLSAPDHGTTRRPSAGGDVHLWEFRLRRRSCRRRVSEVRPTATETFSKTAWIARRERKLATTQKLSARSHAAAQPISNDAPAADVQADADNRIRSRSSSSSTRGQRRPGPARARVTISATNETQRLVVLSHTTGGHQGGGVASPSRRAAVRA